MRQDPKIDKEKQNHLPLRGFFLKREDIFPIHIDSPIGYTDLSRSVSDEFFLEILLRAFRALESEFPEFDFDSLEFKAYYFRFSSNIFLSTGAFFITHYMSPPEIYPACLIRN